MLAVAVAVAVSVQVLALAASSVPRVTGQVPTALALEGGNPGGGPAPRPEVVQASRAAVGAPLLPALPTPTPMPHRQEVVVRRLGGQHSRRGRRRRRSRDTAAGLLARRWCRTAWSSWIAPSSRSRPWRLSTKSGASRRPCWTSSTSAAAACTCRPVGALAPVEAPLHDAAAAAARLGAVVAPATATATVPSAAVWVRGVMGSSSSSPRRRHSVQAVTRCVRSVRRG